MKSYLIIENLICLILLFSITATAQTLDPKVVAMGQIALIIEDQNNQLNLYDFGLNPACLIVDQ